MLGEIHSLVNDFPEMEEIVVNLARADLLVPGTVL